MPFLILLLLIDILLCFITYAALASVNALATFTPLTNIVVLVLIQLAAIALTILIFHFVRRRDPPPNDIL